MANDPQVYGPGAPEIELEAVPDATGSPYSPDDTAAAPNGPAEQSIADANKVPEPEPDPMFPFGKPENIDYSLLDPVGHELIAEFNLRPWVKTTEYCSGHPLDRPIDEGSELYPYVTGENVYAELQKLDYAYIRGLINDNYFKHRKTELREAGATRFYLNVNVYDISTFLEWARLASALVIAATHSDLYPLIIRFNPLRPGTNFSIYWDYWTLDERDLIHTVLLTALMNFPV